MHRLPDEVLSVKRFHMHRKPTTGGEQLLAQSAISGMQGCSKAKYLQPLPGILNEKEGAHSNGLCQASYTIKNMLICKILLSSSFTFMYTLRQK